MRKLHYNLHLTVGEFEVYGETKAQDKVKIFTKTVKTPPTSSSFIPIHLCTLCCETQLLQVLVTTCSFMLLYLCLVCFLYLKFLFTHSSRFKPPLPESFLTLLMKIKWPLPQYIYLDSAPHCIVVTHLYICGYYQAEAISLFCMPRSQKQCTFEWLSKLCSRFFSFILFILHQWSYGIDIGLILWKRKLWRWNCLALSL